MKSNCVCVGGGGKVDDKIQSQKYTKYYNPNTLMRWLTFNLHFYKGCFFHICGQVSVKDFFVK